MLATARWHILINNNNSLNLLLWFMIYNVHLTTWLADVSDLRDWGAVVEICIIIIGLRLCNFIKTTNKNISVTFFTSFLSNPYIIMSLYYIVYKLEWLLYKYMYFLNPCQLRNCILFVISTYIMLLHYDTIYDVFINWNIIRLHFKL